MENDQCIKDEQLNLQTYQKDFCIYPTVHAQGICKFFKSRKEK